MQDFITFFSNHLALTSAAIFVFALLTIIEFMRAKRATYSLNPTQMTQLINHQHAVVIDIRGAEQYRQGHVIDALSMTATDLNNNGKKLEKFKNKPLIVVCPSGNESQKIAALLLKRGYNAYSLAGGMRAWRTAQMPEVKAS